MEIHEKIKLKGIEIDCEVDTGTTYTVVKKEILKKARVNPVKKIKAIFADGREKEVNAYLEPIEINGCRLPPVILIEGEQNLLGHNVLQQLGAIVDEKRGRITYRVCPSPVPKI